MSESKYIYFGTLVRNGPICTAGELVKLNWSTKQVEKRIYIYPTNPDLFNHTNPRGGPRGCRGIEIWDGNILAANYHTLALYNLDLAHIEDYSFNLMNDIHEIRFQEKNNILVTSTHVDAVLKYDLVNRKLIHSYWPREDTVIQRELNLNPFEIDKNMDIRSLYIDGKRLNDPSHLHINAVAIKQGEIYALFNKQGVIVNLDQKNIVVMDPELKGSHNLQFIGNNSILVGGSYTRDLRVYDTNTGHLSYKINLMDFDFIRNTYIKSRLKNGFLDLLCYIKILKSSISRPIYVRGLDLVNNFLYVGISPATVLKIDLTTNKLTDYFQYSTNVNVCIHGLKVYNPVS